MSVNIEEHSDFKDKNPGELAPPSISTIPCVIFMSVNADDLGSVPKIYEKSI